MNWRRWDIDERGEGVGDAARQLPALQVFAEAMGQRNWVAEEPEAHLLPHLERACRRAESVWRLVGTESDGYGCFVVRLGWLRRSGSQGELSRDVFALLGEIAEANTYIHHRRDGDAVVFDITTGVLDGEGPFAGHGHTLRLEVRGAAIEAWANPR